MTILWVCLILVALNVLLVGWAARRAFSDRTAPAESDRPKTFPDEGWLRLGDQIFDSSDYLWLRDEVCFPDAAKLLAGHRRELALKWLRSLEDLLKDLARTPGSDPPGARSWRLLASTLRLQLLLTYAFVVVRLFGPYHRIVLPLGGLSAIFRREPARAAPVRDAD